LLARKKEKRKGRKPKDREKERGGREGEDYVTLRPPQEKNLVPFSAPVQEKRGMAPSRRKERGKRGKKEERINPPFDFSGGEKKKKKKGTDSNFATPVFRGRRKRKKKKHQDREKGTKKD